MTTTGGNCKTILVVEDDFEIRNILCELLELEGYDVHSAGNGKEGLDLLPKMEEPCLILLDLMMPVMDGFEFLHAKKRYLKIAPIPVVIISALDPGMEPPGAAKFIKKPIQIDTLLQVVREYCGMPSK